MAVGVTLIRGTACARVRNENARRSNLPIRGSIGGHAQKRREGESRDDLRHGGLLRLSGPLMARMSITCRNVFWCAVTTITEWHLVRRVIPLTLIGKADDRLAIRAPIAPPDNA